MSTFPEVSLDVESRSTVDLRKTGMYKYWEAETTDLWCACFAVDDGPVHTWLEGEPPPPLWQEMMEAGAHVYAWNAIFEFLALTKKLGPLHGWAVPKVEQMYCSASYAAAMGLPRDLGGAANALGLDVTKDVKGRMLMLQMARPRRVESGNAVYWNTAEKIKRLAEYCVVDVEVERAARKRVRPLSPSERELWLLDAAINARGVAVDTKAVKHAARIVAQATDALNGELALLTNHAVTSVTAAASMRDWLNAHGVETDSVDKQSVKAMLELDLTPDVRRVLEIRKEAARSSTAKLGAYLDRASDDGRAKENLMFHGASTGRWSARGVQLQNLPRPDMSREHIEMAFKLLPKADAPLFDMLFGNSMSVITNLLRGFVTAEPGKVLLSSDFSQIEGRVLAWLAGEDWKLRAFEAFDRGEGPDLYKVTAALILNKRVEDITKEERQTYGKVPELACGYGGGVGAFQTMASTYLVEIPDEQAEEIKTIWRDKHPATVANWYDCEDAAKAAVFNNGKMFRAGKVSYACKGNVLWCKLPSGRLLAYVNPRIEDVLTPWGAMRPSITYMTVNSVTRRWEREKTYSGKLVENITQAVARDMMAEAMLRVARAGYSIVLTVHDEIVCEVDEDKADVKAFERLMAELPTWAAGLPVATEGDASRRFRK